MKGYQAQQKGNFGQALSFYSKAVTLGLKNAVIYNDMAVVYDQLGLQDKAEEYYMEAVRSNPDYLPPYTNLAYLYQEQGDDTRAAEFFRKRLEKAPPDDPWVARIEEDFYRMNPQLKREKIERESRELHQEMVEKARQEFVLQVIRADKHFQNGQLLLTEKKFGEALVEFDRALALTPGNPKILELRKEAARGKRAEHIRRRADKAVSQLETGDAESARKEFQGILADFPDP
ncbi:MAG: tetratricopeptide repeat protein [Candidatus Omnitrophota bacterium]|nr:tetratricopeptide repeat protein [Candidatus Omnitrophota bacterium]MDZ4242957.1 tetratricopeptide repeat protein [Candidatus Omnitrophota bacterium]